MTKVKCISKNRNTKGAIVSYTLQDANGATMNVTGQQIKQAITNGQVEIINLQIDKAGRLIDKPIETSQVPKTYSVKSSNINIEKQAEIFIRFIKDIKTIIDEDDFHFELKDNNVEEQILNQCAKRYPNREFTDDYNSRKMSRIEVCDREEEIYLNELFANFIFGNLKKVDILLAENWYERHAEELVEEGDYTEKEMEKLIEEENKYYYKECNAIKKALDDYHNGLNVVEYK